jgi:hypothetical protein
MYAVLQGCHYFLDLEKSVRTRLTAVPQHILCPHSFPQALVSYEISFGGSKITSGLHEYDLAPHWLCVLWWLPQASLELC